MERGIVRGVWVLGIRDEGVTGCVDCIGGGRK